MRNISLKVLSTGLFLGALACGQTSDADLSRDLDVAKSDNGLELAPSNNRTEVMSATERFAKGTPAPRASQRSVSRVSAPQSEVEAFEPVEAPPVVAQVEEAPAPQPAGGMRPQPVGRSKQTPPPGGWKTVGDVIRNAPFPINP